MVDDISDFPGQETGIDRHHAGAEFIQRQEMQEKLGPVVQHDGNPLAVTVPGSGVLLTQVIGCLQGLFISVINRPVRIFPGSLARDMQESLCGDFSLGLQKLAIYGSHFQVSGKMPIICIYPGVKSSPLPVKMNRGALCYSINFLLSSRLHIVFLSVRNKRMANKRTFRKRKIESIRLDDKDNNWSVVYGKLQQGPGQPPKTKPLFKCVGEKIPFSALHRIKQKLEGKEGEVEGVYIAHDSMGTARYVGRGKIFSRLKQHKNNYPNELVYFSFFVVKDKQHEREVETLLIRGAGPLLELNERKKGGGIYPGDVKDYEAGTDYFERQIKKGRKAS